MKKIIYSILCSLSLFQWCAEAPQGNELVYDLISEYVYKRLPKINSIKTRYKKKLKGLNRSRKRIQDLKQNTSKPDQVKQNLKGERFLSEKLYNDFYKLFKKYNQIIRPMNRRLKDIMFQPHKNLSEHAVKWKANEEHYLERLDCETLLNLYHWTGGFSLIQSISKKELEKLTNINLKYREQYFSHLENESDRSICENLGLFSFRLLLTARKHKITIPFKKAGQPNFYALFKLLEEHSKVNTQIDEDLNSEAWEQADSDDKSDSK